jgi:hypothetical protein
MEDKVVAEGRRKREQRLEGGGDCALPKKMRGSG